MVEVRSGGVDLMFASLPGVPQPGRLTPHHASPQRLLGSQSTAWRTIISLSLKDKELDTRGASSNTGPVTVKGTPQTHTEALCVILQQVCDVCDG